MAPGAVGCGGPPEGSPGTYGSWSVLGRALWVFSKENLRDGGNGHRELCLCPLWAGCQPLCQMGRWRPEAGRSDLSAGGQSRGWCLLSTRKTPSPSHAVGGGRNVLGILGDRESPIQAQFTVTTSWGTGSGGGTRFYKALNGSPRWPAFNAIRRGCLGSSSVIANPAPLSGSPVPMQLGT